MPTEVAPSPLRVVDVDKMREEFAAIEVRQAVLTHDGQKLLARIIDPAGIIHEAA